MSKKKKDYPGWICHSCGNRYGKNPDGRICTWHPDTCGVCDKETSCTEPRDYGHLNDGWENHKEPEKRTLKY